VPGQSAGSPGAGDVVTQRDPDGGTGRIDADYHDARFGRLEPEHERDGGQQAGRGADADDLRAGLGTGNAGRVGADLGLGTVGAGNGHGSETLLGSDQATGVLRAGARCARPRDAAGQWVTPARTAGISRGSAVAETWPPSAHGSPSACAAPVCAVPDRAALAVTRVSNRIEAATS